MAVGEPMGLKPGHTSSIRRIEAAMLSYHADMTLANNPFEMGMDRLVDLDMDSDFVSKKALTAIKAKALHRNLSAWNGWPSHCWSNDENWSISINGQKLAMSRLLYSPRLDKISPLPSCGEHSDIGTQAVMHTNLGDKACQVVPKPFHDPKKAIAAHFR